MRRIASAAVITLGALLLSPGAALGSHQESGAEGSQRDFAVGTGMNQVGRVSFAAHGGPSPLEPVTGHFHARGEFPPTNPFNIEGPVTCLTVVGREAALFYPVRDPGPTEPHGVFIYLRDSGNPKPGNAPDQIGFIPVAGPITTPPACPLMPPLANIDLERGNVTIHDGG
jgi:hypothetical protein